MVKKIKKIKIKIYCIAILASSFRMLQILFSSDKSKYFKNLVPKNSHMKKINEE